jgi:phage tail-like protein
MPEFTVNTHRRAPYKRFKFRVHWDDREIPGIVRVSGLRRHTEPVVERSGEDPNRTSSSPGLTTFDPITLESGRTHDPAFEDWVADVHAFQRRSTDETDLPQYRKHVRIELLNAAGQVVMAFLVRGCWPSSYTALDELDAMASETAVESLTLQHDGWERDREVVEPTEGATGGRAGVKTTEVERPAEKPSKPTDTERGKRGSKE